MNATTSTFSFKQIAIDFKEITKAGLAITALWYLGKNHVNENVIHTIKHRLNEKQFVEVLKHTNQMPVWMASAFNQYQK